MKCWNWPCSLCSGDINLSAVRRTRRSRSAFCWGFHHFKLTAQWAHCHQSPLCVGFPTWCSLNWVNNGLFTTYLKWMLTPIDSAVLTRPDLLNYTKWPSWPTGRIHRETECFVLVAKACASWNVSRILSPGDLRFTYRRFAAGYWKEAVTQLKKGQREQKAAHTNFASITYSLRANVELDT